MGFDINEAYCAVSDARIPKAVLPNRARQITVCADARTMSDYLHENSIALSFTSPPYANLLNRARKNKSRRGEERKNDQYGKVEQYSQRADDLGTLSVEAYEHAMYDIYARSIPS